MSMGHGVGSESQGLGGSGSSGDIGPNRDGTNAADTGGSGGWGTSRDSADYLRNPFEQATALGDYTVTNGSEYTGDPDRDFDNADMMQSLANPAPPDNADLMRSYRQGTHPDSLRGLKNGYYETNRGDLVDPRTGMTVGKRTALGGHMTTTEGYGKGRTAGVSGFQITSLHDRSNPHNQAYQDARASHAASQQAEYEEQQRQQAEDHVRSVYGHFDDPEVMAMRVGGQLERAFHAGKEIDPRSLDFAARYGAISPEIGAQVATNQAKDQRGFLGRTWDMFTGREYEADPTGLSRTLSPQAFEKLGKRGAIGTAVDGLGKGLMHTNAKGEFTEDRWGNAWEVMGPALMSAASAGVLGVAGMFTDGPLGQAFNTGGAATAGSALTPNPNLETAFGVADQSLSTTLASLGGLPGTTFSRAINLNDMRTKFGINTGGQSFGGGSVEGGGALRLPGSIQTAEATNTGSSPSPTKTTSPASMSRNSLVSMYDGYGYTLI